MRSPQAPPGAQELLQELDILVDGALTIRSLHSLVSSRNQRVQVFNPALESQLNWASDQVEIEPASSPATAGSFYLRDQSQASAPAEAAIPYPPTHNGSRR